MEEERKKMSRERSEEEKTGDVWREVSYELTPEELERSRTVRVESDLPTFKGKICVNPGKEGRGKNLLGDKRSDAYSSEHHEIGLHETTSPEELERRIERGQQKTR